MTKEQTPYICWSLVTGEKLIMQFHEPGPPCGRCGESICVRCGARLERNKGIRRRSLRPVRPNQHVYFIGNTEFGQRYGLTWATAIAVYENKIPLPVWVDQQ